MTLPKQYGWLDTLGVLPRTIQEGLKLYGTLETPGPASSKAIMDWKIEIQAAGLSAVGYTSDAVAWCGLYAAVVALRAGKRPPDAPLWALNWRTFGKPVDPAGLGDVLVFKRPTPTGVAGHVGFYIAEDPACYHVLAGNQGDAVSIARIQRSRCVAMRSPAYSVRPASAVPYRMTATGAVSINEA
jgi:uncharacterized protein (TIGR02594 family)